MCVFLASATGPLTLAVSLCQSQEKKNRVFKEIDLWPADGLQAKLLPVSRAWSPTGSANVRVEFCFGLMRDLFGGFPKIGDPNIIVP